MTERDCPCLVEPQSFDTYTAIRFVGVDATEGRYGEVRLKQCKTCDRYWLDYFFEKEAFTGSGRYILGRISGTEAERMTPEMAVPYLESLEWYLYGGTFFGG